MKKGVLWGCLFSLLTAVCAHPASWAAQLNGLHIEPKGETLQVILETDGPQQFELKTGRNMTLMLPNAVLPEAFRQTGLPKMLEPVTQTEALVENRKDGLKVRLKSLSDKEYRYQVVLRYPGQITPVPQEMTVTTTQAQVTVPTVDLRHSLDIKPSNRVAEKTPEATVKAPVQSTIQLSQAPTPVPSLPKAEANSLYRIVIHVPSRKLSLYQGDKVIQTYPVGVGRKNFPTPVGQFRIFRKIPHPMWENPYFKEGEMVIQAGKDNPLGTRWLGFAQDAHGEYGIHGTYNTQSVGQFSSHGCIRMRIKDVEALYKLVGVGTPVEIR